MMTDKELYLRIIGETSKAKLNSIFEYVIQNNRIELVNLMFRNIKVNKKLLLKNVYVLSLVDYGKPTKVLLIELEQYSSYEDSRDYLGALEYVIAKHLIEQGHTTMTPEAREMATKHLSASAYHKDNRRGLSRKLESLKLIGKSLNFLIKSQSQIDKLMADPNIPWTTYDILMYYAAKFKDNLEFMKLLIDRQPSLICFVDKELQSSVLPDPDAEAWLYSYRD